MESKKQAGRVEHGHAARKLTPHLLPLLQHDVHGGEGLPQPMLLETFITQEKIRVQKGQKGTPCGRTPQMSCQATMNTARLLVTRTGHQKPKSSLVTVRALLTLPEVPTPCSKLACPVKQGF